VILVVINPFRHSTGVVTPPAPDTSTLPATLPFRLTSAAVEKFPGHVANRVLVGYAAPSSGGNRPDWDEAPAIIGQPVYEARRFEPSWINTTDFNKMVDEAAEVNALPVISFKVPGNDWIGVATGNYDADLTDLYDLAVGQRTAGPGGIPRPFLCSFHHEPAGDGALGEWASMQRYCAWYFGGRRGGTATSTYNAAHDVRDIMGWAPCGNGFWWATNNSTHTTARGQAFPATLITALNANRGVVMNDFYDVDYPDMELAKTSVAARVPDPNSAWPRVSGRISNFITWARANGVQASGCGEFGAIDGTELTACWQVMRANRDIWCIANYFNSFANSDHEWRLIPSTYPAYNGTAPNGFVDFGGNAQSQGRLNAFKTMLTESTSATYSSPL
jgi:hypothetical protein